jgi:molybdopterin synthase catalytic subunit
VLAFARVRELIGSAQLSLELPKGTTLRDCWRVLLERFPSLAPLQNSTRISRNGRIESLDVLVEDRDEIALLPPVGGG